jgi:hypothetical protein
MSNRPLTVTTDELQDLADRLLMTSGSIRVPRPLRSDLLLAARLLHTLLKTGVVTAPIELLE